MQEKVMIKDVCILTSEESFLNNYGAALQGYALYTYIKSKQYAPNIVRYRGGMQKKWKSLSIKGKLNRLIRKTYRFFFPSNIIKTKRFAEKKYRKQIQEREQYFQRFQQEYMTFYNDKRYDWDDLRENPVIADIYVCGSDQIWNPYFKGGKNDLGYFLDFAPIDKPRIAYAPSLGCNELPQPAKGNFKELIDKFLFVSIREKTGQALIEETTGRKVPVTLDPTLLLDRKDWEKVLRVPDNIPKEYILCYRFSENDETKMTIDALSQKFNLPVLTLPLSIPALKDDYQKFFCAGPAEFIGLIANAKLVCTDSFHATVFSLIFHTPFIVFLRENFIGSNNNMNSRVMDLLEFSNLENRVWCNMRDIQEKQVFNVDFTTFDNNVKLKRKESREWLDNALMQGEKRY